MNILLIYPQPRNKYLEGFYYQQGLGTIISVLKKAGHNVVLVQDCKANGKKLFAIMQKFKPKIIGISVTTDSFPVTKDIVKHLKKYSAKIVLGGCHPTIAPEECLEVEGVFGVCIGEGEEALLELVNKLENRSSSDDIYSTKNFWFKNKGAIIKNELRPLIENLDSLPFPDREIFNYTEILKNPNYVADVMASKGCPYQCTYCINHTLIKIYSGKGRYVRYKSANYLIAEIKKLLSDYPRINYLCFQDDLFTFDRKWLKRFCKQYKKKIGLPFKCNSRINLIDKELVSILKNAGCIEVGIAIESGNDFIRNKILKKNISQEQIIRSFQLLKKAKIKTLCFNMIGLPFETKESIMDTIRINRKVKSEGLQCSIFNPYPATEAYDLCKKYGWISERKVESYFLPVSTLNQHTIKKETVEYHYKMFNWSVKHPVLSVFIAPFMMVRWGKNKENFLYDYTILPAIQFTRNTMLKLSRRRSQEKKCKINL